MSELLSRITSDPTICHVKPYAARLSTRKADGKFSGVKFLIDGPN